MWLGGDAPRFSDPANCRGNQGNSQLAAGGTAPATEAGMALWLRILLWSLVVVVPGGVLLTPILAADAVRRRSRSAAARS